MQQTIVMLTGVPGSGKSTVVEGFLREFSKRGVSVAHVDEYRHILEWKDSPEGSQWVRPHRLGSFDILLEGYWPMSEVVGERLAKDINSSFNAGNEVVIFETARGVGKPRVTYSDFWRMINGRLVIDRERVGLAHIETRSLPGYLEERIVRRHIEFPSTAPPPGIELKYLTNAGFPLCLATEDLETHDLGIPLLMNEFMRNGGPKKEFVARIHDELFPRFVELSMNARNTPEGRLRGPERR